MRKEKASMSDYLNEFYTHHCDEDKRLAFRHSQIEFITTVRYIEKYLKTGNKIIEIGAGTGAYSHYFAQKGYVVDSVELVEHNIDIFNSKISPDEKITITQGNALDLSEFPDSTYDITLLLGPMYHLYTAEEQLKAMSEAIRVTKKGGIIFAAYCGNDATIIQFALLKGQIVEEPYAHLIDESFKCTSTPEEIFQLHRKEDIDMLMSNFNVKRLNFIGTDMISHYFRNQINEMTEDVYKKYLDYHMYICERADMIGMINHFLDVFRKQ